MVYAIVALCILWCVSGWAFNVAYRHHGESITKLKSENLRLAEAIKVHERRLKTADAHFDEFNKTDEDQEARIAFCESQLTAKTSTAKIVPKPQKRTFRQFAEAASKASETEETSPNDTRRAPSIHRSDCH